MTGRHTPQPQPTPQGGGGIPPRTFVMLLAAAGAGAAVLHDAAWSGTISVAVAVYLALDHTLSGRM